MSVNAPSDQSYLEEQAPQSGSQLAIAPQAGGTAAAPAERPSILPGPTDRRPEARGDAAEQAKKDDYGDPSSIIRTWFFVFTGLFASVVSAFIIESYKLLQPDSRASAVVFLAQISQHLAAASNDSTSTFPTPLPDSDSASFHLTSSAYRVNVLWFLSLSLSLVCALSATLTQQWSRRYLTNVRSAQRAGLPQRQGRIHAYLFQGLHTFRFNTAVETLPALLHASVALFFAGLVEFLFSVSTCLAHIILAFTSVIAFIYVGLTLLSSHGLNSPYATQLSSIIPSYITIIFLRPIWRALRKAFLGPYSPVLWWHINREHIRRRALFKEHYAARRRMSIVQRMWTQCTVAPRLLHFEYKIGIVRASWAEAVKRNKLLKFDGAAVLILPSKQPPLIGHWQ